MSFVCLELFEGKDSFFCKFMLLSNFCYQYVVTGQ